MKKSSLLFLISLLVLSISFIVADNSFALINYSSNATGQNNIINITINNNLGVNITQINITTPFMLGSSSGTNFGSVYADSHSIYVKNLSAPSILPIGASGYFYFNVTNPTSTGNYTVGVSTLDTLGNINTTSLSIIISGTTTSNTNTSTITNVTQNQDTTEHNNTSNQNSTIKEPRPLPSGSGVRLGAQAETDSEREIKISHALSQEIVCRINFNLGVINTIISQFPNVSSQLHPALTSLQNDLSQVQSIGNTSEVQSFVKGQFTEDMKNALSKVPTRELKEISLDQRAILVSSYNQLKTTFDQCEQQAYTNISQERLNSYQNQIANFQNQSSNLAARGFDTTSLTQILQDAQTQIMTPLQNAVSSATTAQQVQTAVKTYCSYDGCVNGTNFHLEAKFNLARAKIVLADLQKNAAAFNLDNNSLSLAQQDLTDAQTVLDSVGTSVYQQGQSQQIFGDIRSASKIIVQLMAKALKQPIGGLK